MRKMFYIVIFIGMLAIICTKLTVAGSNTDNNVHKSEPYNVNSNKQISNHYHMLNDLIDKIATDVVNTSGIELTGYTRIELKEVLTNNIYRTNRLAEIYSKITQTLRNYDYQPFLYINGDKGYIIVKRSNGINEVYVLLNDKIWGVYNKLTAQGRIFTP